MLPILYDTVTLTTPAKIKRFARAINEATAVAGLRPSALSLVRRLWIGSTESGTPRYPHKARLSAIEHTAPVCQILSACTSLQSLALVSIPLDVWKRLVPAIPASVQDLTLGPAHSRVDWASLPCTPALRRFTSVSTVMVDSEFCGVALAPRIRAVRRVFRARDPALFSLCLSQLGRIDRTSRLEELEFVCCADPADAPRPDAVCLVGSASGAEAAREGVQCRVMLSIRSPVTLDGQNDFMAVVFEDWIAVRSGW